MLRTPGFFLAAANLIHENRKGGKEMKGKVWISLGLAAILAAAPVSVSFAGVNNAHVRQPTALQQTTAEESEGQLQITGIVRFNELEGGFYQAAGYRLQGDFDFADYLGQVVKVVGELDQEPSIQMVKTIKVQTLEVLDLPVWQVPDQAPKGLVNALKNAGEKSQGKAREVLTRNLERKMDRAEAYQELLADLEELVTSGDLSREEALILVEEAREEIKLQVEEQKERAKALKETARWQERYGDLQAALESITEAVYFDPSARDYYKELGRIKLDQGDRKFKTFINGSELPTEVPPRIEGDRLMVPFRALAESLGAEVIWDQDNKTITLTRGDDQVVVTVDKIEATINGETYELDVPARIVDGRTLVPVRFISEALGAEVDYEPVGNVVIVVED